MARASRKRAAVTEAAVESDAGPHTMAKDTEETSVDAESLTADEEMSNGLRASPSDNNKPHANTNKPTNNALADSDSSDQVSDDSDGGLNGEGGADSWRAGLNEDDEEEDEEDDEEILVVLELADFKNHPILDDYKSITIEGIDTPKPTLHIGEYSLHGQLEETVGTHYFYDTKNRTDDNEYRYAGQTTKKIKFTIAPPDEY